MINLFNISICIFSIFSLQACNMFQSTLDKQIKMCSEDEKRQLNDPNSLEIVSTEQINVKNGWFRIKVNYTAKNLTGGRARGQTVCGFKNMDSLEFNNEDFMESARQIVIKLAELNRKQ